MKKVTIIGLLCITLITIVVLNLDTISDKVITLIDSNPKVEIAPGNDYTKDVSYKYVSLSKDYIPYSYNDILDILYSAINNGWEQFTFYCPSEYTNCLKDMEQISDDAVLLTHLNNFVHPYNSFTNLKSSIKESGEITLKITYLYTKEDITYINKKVKEIIKNNIKNDMNDYDKIKSIHDYIINNTKYDVERNENGDSTSDSYKATGLLKDHLATCNGYSDMMAIMLSAMGYDNYKIATTPDEISYSATGHVWNAVKVDGKWLHLDLTWDDPVSSDNKDYLYHKYFLVTNEEMEEADKGDVVIEEHNFNKSIYLEFQ